MTLIYDMSMFCKIQRVIRMKLSRYDHGIMTSVVTRIWPDTITVQSSHTLVKKPFEFERYYAGAKEPIAIFNNAELNVTLIIHIID